MVRSGDVWRVQFSSFKGDTEYGLRRGKNKLRG